MPHLLKWLKQTNAVIGPSSKVVSAMGDKANARELAKKLNIPVPKVSEGEILAQLKV